MNRDKWEHQFKLQLKAKFGITPEQVNFRWKQYFSQRYTPEQMIASPKLKHLPYRSLGFC